MSRSWLPQYVRTMEATKLGSSAGKTDTTRFLQSSPLLCMASAEKLSLRGFFFWLANQASDDKASLWQEYLPWSKAGKCLSTSLQLLVSTNITYIIDWTQLHAARSGEKGTRSTLTLTHIWGQWFNWGEESVPIGITGYNLLNGFLSSFVHCLFDVSIVKGTSEQPSSQHYWPNYCRKTHSPSGIYILTALAKSKLQDLLYNWWFYGRELWI